MLPDKSVRHIISIHPPRAGWDCISPSCRLSNTYFNPPTPCGVGREEIRLNIEPRTISIHPPRAGWDRTKNRSHTRISYFNPPTPCGVGRCKRASGEVTPKFQSTHPVRGGTAASAEHDLRDYTFQSTHPVRGGTQASGLKGSNKGISIHPPRAGWDELVRGLIVRITDFNPPTPCGVGLRTGVLYNLLNIFQSTHPVRGGTRR